MYSKLLLTTEDSKLQLWDNGKIKTLFQKKEMGGAMGLIIDKNNIFVNTPSFLYSLKKDTYEIVNTSKKQRAQYHHMNMYNDKIYVSATEINEIHVYNRKLNLEKRIKINPPKPKQRVIYKNNYNHLNTVIKKDNKFYVNLNWFDKQYGMSGVAILNENWKEINRFKLGWESHDLQFFGEKLIVIAATSNPDKQINHPKKSGIMIDGEFIFEHDPNESFCKALAWDENYFYLCGGAKAKRENRLKSNGIIYIIDKNNFNLIDKISNEKIANIKGCRTIK